MHILVHVTICSLVIDTANKLYIFIRDQACLKAMRRRKMVSVGVLSLLQKKGSWCLGWGNWSKPCLEDKAKSLILSSSSQAWRVGSAFWSWNWTRKIRWWVKMKYTEVGSRSMSLAKTPWRATSCFPNCFKTCKYAHVQKRSQKLWAALWTSTWAPTGTVFLTYVVTLFFGIKFLLKITTGIWHQSTSARSWFYSSTLDHRCAFACVLCMWSITVCLRMNTWNITYNNFFPARSWASGGQGVCSSAGQGVPLQERFTG